MKWRALRKYLDIPSSLPPISLAYWLDMAANLYPQRQHAPPYVIHLIRARHHDARRTHIHSTTPTHSPTPKTQLHAPGSNRARPHP